MSALRLATRLLDPAGGDDLENPNRRLRLDLRRVELVGMFTILVCVMEGIFSLYRGIEGYLAACCVGGGIAIGFILTARWGQRHNPSRLAFLPEFFVSFALSASLTLCVMIAMHGRMQWGVALVYFACAIIFLIPPRRFAVIGLLVFCAFIATTLIAPVTPFERADAIFNTSMAFGFGTLGRWGIDRLQNATQSQMHQIADQNERLSRQNNELNSLMAIAAHDLRSPLLGLRNLLQLAGARPPSTREHWEDLLGAADSGISSMEQLISRILQAHEVETGLKLQLQSVCLETALRNALRRHQATADRFKINLRIETGSSRPLAIADDLALAQILDNLLSNALRFSDAGTTIDLRAHGGPDPFLEVKDNGRGLDPDMQTTLFKKFARGERQPNNGEWGSGLGLYIAQTLAQSMGGRIQYAPNGVGSTFRITLKPETSTWSPPSTAHLISR